MSFVGCALPRKSDYGSREGNATLSSVLFVTPIIHMKFTREGVAKKKSGIDSFTHGRNPQDVNSGDSGVLAVRTKDDQIPETPYHHRW